MRNRARVVEAAHRVFCTRGTDVSVREVAKEAGVGLGTVYRHFADKEALIAAVVEHRFRSLTEQTRAAMASMSAWDAFAHVLRLMAQMMNEDRAFAGSIGAARTHRGESADSDDPIVVRDRARDDLDVALGELADAAQAAGELRPDVGPMELGMLLAGAAFAMEPGRAGGPASRSPSNPPSNPPSDPPWDRYLTVVLDGLRVRS